MKNNRLFNILFPVWLFYLLPTGMWLLILPANFLLDSLVLYLAARYLHLEAGKLWQQSIVRVWLLGFISDFLGALLILAAALLQDKICPGWNTFYFPGATLLAIPGVILSAGCIYFFDRRFAFTKTGLDEKQTAVLCRFLAVFTAPYAMLIPLYG